MRVTITVEFNDLAMLVMKIKLLVFSFVSFRFVFCFFQSNGMKSDKNEIWDWVWSKDKS